MRERDLLEAGGKLDATRAVERIDHHAADVAVGLLKALDPLDAGAAAVKNAGKGEDVGDLLRSHGPVPTRLAIAVRDQRGKVLDAPVELRHRHEVVVAEHVAPVQRDPTADIRAETIRRAGERD